MKTDLDRLMAERGLDALLVLPGEHEDPYRTYLSNGADFAGMVIKKRGTSPVIIVQEMERDEAAKSGLVIYTYDDFGYSQLLRDHAGDYDQVRANWYRRIFDQVEVRGTVTVYGVGDINTAYHTLRLLRENFGDRLDFVTEAPPHTIFDLAYETKDADEIERLRDVARRTGAVMCATRDWIATHRAGADVVLTAGGTPLTIGAVKRHVRGLLFEQGLEDPSGMIFAQGRDAGVPHSKGTDDEPVQLGQTIVFDLFPRTPRGYFADMTRTWCIGHAPPVAQAAHTIVMEAYRRSVTMCAPDAPTYTVQQMVCDYFEAEGHPTVSGTPSTTDGYVHSLAHGIGLNVHEAPYFRLHSKKTHLQPGNVFTIEPGLYYPKQGYGVRIENTVYLNDQGELETLTACPYDLVIELAESGS